MKDFDEWNKEKKIIETKEFPEFVRERQIWWCSLGLNIGDEQDGKNHLFERPVLVLRKFNKRIALIVPLTTKNKLNDYHFSFIREGVTFNVILSQIRLVSTSRFTRKVRIIDEGLFEEIKWQIVKRLF